jgi:hypothetical protein
VTCAFSMSASGCQRWSGDPLAEAHVEEAASGKQAKARRLRGRLFIGLNTRGRMEPVQRNGLVIERWKLCSTTPHGHTGSDGDGDQPDRGGAGVKMSGEGK